MVSINKINEMPVLTRKGRMTEEVIMVRDALTESKNNNSQPFELDGIESSQYNSWQQRIRSQAKRLGVNVELRFNSEESKLAFRAVEKDSTKQENNLGKKPKN